MVNVFPALWTLRLQYVPTALKVDISPLAGLTGLRFLEVGGATPSRTSAVRAAGVKVRLSGERPAPDLGPQRQGRNA